MQIHLQVSGVLSVECFAAAKLATVKARYNGENGSVSADVLYALAIDLTWIIQFYYLWRLAGGDRSISWHTEGCDFTEQDFVMALTAGSNAYGAIRTALKQAKLAQQHVQKRSSSCKTSALA